MRRAAIPACAAALLVLVARGAAADLVVFEDGRHLKVDGYAADGDLLELRFHGGGRLVVSLERVERIVDDEVDWPAAEAPPRIEADAARARSVRRPATGPPLGLPAYEEIVRAAAARHGIDPALVAAVVRAESGFDPRAVSRKGARGLMQLMPATARRLGVARAFDPGQNVAGGVAYLAWLAERFGADRPDLVLAAYNAGEAAVEAHDGVPPYRETRAYVKKVLAFWDGYARAADASVSAAGPASP